jgi:hypothetical protein
LTFKNAADMGKFSSDQSDSEIADSIVELIEGVLQDPNARTIIAMYLINIRAHELFASSRFYMFEEAMVTARDEVFMLLASGLIGRTLRRLICKADTFRALFEEVKDSDDAATSLLKVLQVSNLVQNTLSWVEREIHLEQAA